MIGNITFVSKSEAAKCEICPSTYLISIIDASGQRPAFNRKFGKILALEFDDVTEKFIGLEVSDVPDLNVNHLNGDRIMVDGCDFCDYNDAIRINKFLSNMQTDKKSLNFIIHCEMGVSRSSAVAKFASEHYGGQADLSHHFMGRHNKRLYRLLVKAFKEDPPLIHEVSKPENWISSNQKDVASAPRSHVNRF